MYLFKSLFGNRYCSAVVSKYFDNVVIENNKFENIQEKAIYCFNYKNSKIINNTFTNVNSGICFEYLPNNFFKNDYSQRMYIANDKSIGKINSKSSTVISGNVMNIKQMAKSSYGIYAYGAKIDSNTAKKKGITAGDYTISDLSIDNNTITVEENSSKSYGIYITGVNKSEISSNILTDDYSSAEDGINGINICASQKMLLKIIIFQVLSITEFQFLTNHFRAVKIYLLHLIRFQVLRVSV